MSEKGFPGGTSVKEPALGREDLLEGSMATTSSILALRILWREELGSYGP